MDIVLQYVPVAHMRSNLYFTQSLWLQLVHSIVESCLVLVLTVYFVPATQNDQVYYAANSKTSCSEIYLPAKTESIVVAHP